MATSTVSVARKPNWSNEEITALVEAVTENHNTIRAKFNPGVTSKTKQDAWSMVVERVNTVNGSSVDRNVVDCKKKWNDVQSSLKRKEACRIRESKKTGGGPKPDDLNVWERKVVDNLSDVVVSGICGGVDSSDTTTPEDLQLVVEIETPECSRTIETNETQSLIWEVSTDKEEKIKPISNKRKRNTEDLQGVYGQSILDIEKEKLEIKKKRLQLEEEKVELLRQILHTLKAPNNDDYLLPVIKF